MYSMQIIRQCAAGVLLLLNSVTTFFHKPGLVGLMFFFTSSVQCPNVWSSIKHLIEVRASPFPLNICFYVKCESVMRLWECFSR